MDIKTSLLSRPEVRSVGNFYSAMPGLVAIYSSRYAQTNLAITRLRLSPAACSLGALPYPRVSVQLSPTVCHIEQRIGATRKSVNAGFGSVSYIPANTAAQWQWNTQLDVLQLHLTSPVIDRMICEYPWLDRRDLLSMDRLADNDPWLGLLSRMLVSELDKCREHASGAFTDSVLGTMLGHIVHHNFNTEDTGAPASRSRMDGDLLKVLAYLQSNVDKTLHLEQLASMANSSVYHFARKFKQHTGMAPHHYVVACRINKAKDLLNANECSVADVAEQCGFANQSHFSRVFHKQVGVTPASYRQNNK